MPNKVIVQFKNLTVTIWIANRVHRTSCTIKYHTNWLNPYRRLRYAYYTVEKTKMLLQ